MKKTININLGQQPFIIDEDAFVILDQYITQLESMFHEQDSSIVADIENRFSEILIENAGKNQVISAQLIEKGIEQIGRPESIGGEEHSYAETQHQENNSSTLYRNSDEKIISGVASGIAHYFGIKESLWVRLVFILTLFTPVTLLYIMLWAVLPSKPLKGEPLQNNNLNTIIKTMLKEVKNAMHELKNSFVSA